MVIIVIECGMEFMEMNGNVGGGGGCFEWWKTRWLLVIIIGALGPGCGPFC